MQITLTGLILGLLARFVLMLVLLGSALAVNEVFRMRSASSKRWEKRRRTFPWTMFACLAASYLLSVPFLVSDFLHVEQGMSFAGVALGIDRIGILSWSIIFAAWVRAVRVLGREILNTRKVLHRSLKPADGGADESLDEVRDGIDYLKSRSRLAFLYGRRLYLQAVQELKNREKQLLDRDNEKNALEHIKCGQIEKSLEYLHKADAPLAVIALVAAECENWKETCKLIPRLEGCSIRNEISARVAYGSGVEAFRTMAEKTIEGECGNRRRAFLLWSRNEVDAARRFLADDRDAYDWL